MIFIIIYMAISFLLDGFISNYLVSDSIFFTIYSLVGLIVIYRYFDEDKKYLYFLIVIAILFDIIYTKTIGLNLVVFMLIYYINRWLNYIIPNNLFCIIVKSLVAMVSYHTFVYIFLLLAGNGLAQIAQYGMILYRSIIMTTVYSVISYLLFKKLFFKLYEKKIK